MTTGQEPTGIHNPEESGLENNRMTEKLSALMIEQEEARGHVVRQASLMVDVLKGNSPDAHPIAYNPAQDFASAPKEIPAFEWESITPKTLAAEGEDDHWKMHIVGNIGEYFTDIYSNERPATVFNTGFYAGVMAVRAGLVDPELFLSDTERRSQLLKLKFEALQINAFCERLGEAGWSFAGGDNVGTQTITIGFGLPEHLAHLGEAAFLGLPIRDEEGDLFPGYEFSLDEDTGEPGMGYSGPLDERFKQVVDAMIEVAQQPTQPE